MKYTISILTYTALTQVKRCIASVLDHSKDFDLILTANGNPEVAKYFWWLSAQRPNIRVVENARNEGFIEPSRKAFAMCDTPYFVLLNDDAVVCPGWLDLLVAPLDLHPMAALSGPVGGCRTLHNDFTGYSGKALEFIEGSCLMVKTELVKLHGLFAPQLVGAYGEDSYLSLRMRELGYSIHQVGFKLEHERATTSKHVPEVKEWHANNVAFLSKRFRHYMTVRHFEYPIVLRRAGAWGDVLLLTPVIRTLKARHPLSPIYVETQCPEVFHNNPMVKVASKMIPRMKGELRLNLDGSYERMLDRHIVDAYAEVCGVTVGSHRPDIFYTAGAHSYLPGSFIAIHPGPVTWPGKSYPFERWNEVADRLASMGLNVVWIGGQTVAGFRGGMNLTGKTTIQEMASVLARCQMFIGLDSLPSHVAAAVDVPSVILFGVTSPKFICSNPEKTIAVCSDPAHPFTGYRHKVSGVTFVPVTDNPMLSITPQMIIHAVKQHLG